MVSGMRGWWRRPVLRTDEDEGRERRTGWLELFYDLVFVAIVAELSHVVADHPGVESVAHFAILFVAAWWMWIGGTIYNDRFETDDASQRLVTLLQMLPVAAMAYFAHDGLAHGSTGFALAYIAGRLIIIGLWLRGGYHNPAFRPVSTRYTMGFSISVALWVVSLAFEPPARIALWIAGLAIDLVTPVTTLEIQRHLPRLSRSHLPERYGLFTIIVLGESVVGVVNGAAEAEGVTIAQGFTGALGLAIAFALWWLYFDEVGERAPRPGPWWIITWSHLHLPFVAGLAVTGAGVLSLVAGADSTPPDALRWILAGSLAVSLTALGLIEMTLGSHPTGEADVNAGVHLAAGLACLLVGALGSGLSGLAIATLLFGIAVVQVVIGIWVHARPVAGVTGPADRAEQPDAKRTTA
jgi:low temperature requirement protein LtrA